MVFFILGVNNENFKYKVVITTKNIRYKFESAKLKQYEKFEEAKQDRSEISIRRTAETILRFLRKNQQACLQ